jgi:diguanylate cyclase (GGDEF)-like protein
LALLHTFPHEYGAELLDRTTLADLFEAEATGIGFTHVEVGVELCQQWGLDEDIVQAVSRHHLTVLAVDQTEPDDSQRLTHALMLAARCAEYLESVQDQRADDRSQLESSLDAQTIPSDLKSIDEFLKEIQLRVGEVAATLSLDIGEVASADNILISAKTALQEIAIKSQLDAVGAQQRAESTAQQLKDAETQKQQLQEHAYRDSLTGAYNRHYLDKVIDQQLELSAERDTSLGFLFMDIDKFKGLNDTYGHALGDTALKTFATIIRGSVRKSDVVIRYGGDEFLVLLVDVTDADITNIAGRICRKVREVELDTEGHVKFSTSIGGILFSPGKTTIASAADLIVEADRAMYEAKQGGGNQVQLYRRTNADATSLDSLDDHAPAGVTD